ncbi:MAG: hypothetical protein HY537_01275 [Deltaproteobacteria bacterium]|nr:hypothetical protein [Deltaproteobacteria bacterium]
MKYRAPAGTGYVEVEAQDCEGVMDEACLQLPAVEEAPSLKSYRDRDREPRIWLGVIGALGGSLGKVSYSDVWSKGLAYGAGAEGFFLLSKNMRAGAGFRYHVLKLSRELDETSGELKEVSVPTIGQSISYVGLSALFGARLGDSETFDGLKNWWVETGFEYAIPISAYQTDSRGGEEKFSSSDRLLLALLGLRGDFALSWPWGVSTTVMAYYNVKGAEGSRLLGLRVDLAFRATF